MKDSYSFHIRQIVSRLVFLCFLCLASYPMPHAMAATDTTAPYGSIRINNGSMTTNSLNVVLSLSAYDREGNMNTPGAQMQFSNDGTIWSIPETYMGVKNWTLSNGSGVKNVYVKFKDSAGHWSTAYSGYIIYGTTFQIQGRIYEYPTNAPPKPLANVVIEIKKVGPPDTIIGTVTTDSYGHYVATVAELGTYYLVPKYKHYQFSPAVSAKFVWNPYQAYAQADFQGKQIPLLKTLFILINHQGNNAQPFTKAKVEQEAFGSHGHNLDDIFMENSYGKLGVEGSVVGWLTAPESSCPSAIRALQLADTQGGVDLSQFTHIVMVVPWLNNGPCGGSGGTSIGQVTYQTSSGKVVQLGGALVVAGDFNSALVTRTIPHELGHTYGMGHANFLNCGNSTIGTDATCTNLEYGDLFSIMGGSVTGHFNAPHKHHMGWFSPQQLATITQPGTYQYVLTPFSSSSNGLKALRIKKGVDATGKPIWYYVEFRQGIGFDSYLSTSYPAITNGALIHQLVEISPNNFGFPHLLDMVPDQGDRSNAALAVGRTFSDPVGVTIQSMNITPLDGGEMGLSVKITKTLPPPVLDYIGPRVAYEGVPVWFDVKATDSSGTPLILTTQLADGSPISTIGANFTDNGNGTGTFRWTPAEGPTQRFYDFKVTAIQNVTGGSTDDEVVNMEVKRHARMTSPPPGSTINTGTVTFNWTPTADVKNYFLSIGTTGVGSSNVYNGSFPATVNSVTISNIPHSGQTLYVRLTSLNYDYSGLVKDYTYLTSL